MMIIVILLFVCAFVFAGEPVISWSFDESVNADCGGAGATQDIASINGAVGVKASVSGTEKAEGFLVDGLSGKAYRIHRDAETKKPVTLSYAPQPALNSLAGSVSFWIRPEWDGAENVRRIFYSADSGSHRIIIFRLPNVPHITFYYGRLNGQEVTSLPVDISQWKKGEWHHLVMTWDKDSMVVFVDAKRSELPMKAVLPERFGKIMIGENWGDESGETLIDELSVYNEKLTDSEAGALYGSMSRQLLKSRSKAPVNIKLGSSTPKLDGRIDDGEYAFAASGMRNIRDNTNYAAQQCRCFLSHDKENLYMGVVGPGSQVVSSCKERDKIDPMDDSVEFWLKFPEEDDFFQFIWNGGGNLFDRKGGDRSWDVSDAHCVSRIDGDVWTLECAIPWKNFPFEVKAGSRFRFDICRSYMKSGMFTTLGSGAHAYGVVPCFAEAELVPDAPIMNLGFLGNLSQGEIDCKGMIRSRLKDTARVSFKAGRGLYPLDYDRSINLEPDKETVFTVKNTNIPQNTILDILVESTKFGLLYSNSFPYRELKEIKFDAIYTKIQEQRLVFRFQNQRLFGTKFTFSFEIRDKNGNILLKENGPIPNDALNPEISFDVSSLPYGVFTMDYSILDSAGNVVAKDNEYYGKYPQDAWASNDGLEDAVPPPWTPLNASDEYYECWGRKVVLGKDSFLSSIKSQDLELLSGPTEIVLNGQRVRFASRLTKDCASFKEFELRSMGCAPELTLKVRAEFDGVMWCELVSGEGAVDSLKLQIPLNRKYIDGFDDCSSIFEKNDLSVLEDCVIPVDSALKPFWWCGGDRVGLMGGLSKQRGRHLKNKPESMLVKVEKDTVLLELMFVDSRLDAKYPRTFSFYLQPTPVKPKNHSLAKIRNDRNSWPWASGVSTFMAYGRDGFWNEEQFKKIHGYKLRDQNWMNIWYMAAKGASPYTPEWSWFCYDWHDCHPGFMVYQTDSAIKDKAARNRGVFTYGCMNCRTFMEFKFDLAKERLRRPEIMNLYYDLAWPKPCHSTHHGCVWKDDFGYTFHEYDLLPLREYYLRVYRCMKKKDPKAVMTGHVISTRLPCDSFFDMLWLGEAYDFNVAKKGGYYDILKPDVMRIAYADRSNEMTIALIAQFGRALQLFAPDKYATFNPKSPENQKAFKHYYAYILLHNLNSSATYHDGEYLKAQDRLGWGGGNVKFFGYWQKDSPLSLTPAGSRHLASCYSGNGNFFAIVLNDTDKPSDFTLSMDFRKAGIPSGTKGVDIMTGEEFQFTDGSEKLHLGGRDAKMLLFTTK